MVPRRETEVPRAAAGRRRRLWAAAQLSAAGPGSEELVATLPLPALVQRLGGAATADAGGVVATGIRGAGIPGRFGGAGGVVGMGGGGAAWAVGSAAAPGGASGTFCAAAPGALSVAAPGGVSGVLCTDATGALDGTDAVSGWAGALAAGGAGGASAAGKDALAVGVPGGGGDGGGGKVPLPNSPGEALGEDGSAMGRRRQMLRVGPVGDQRAGDVGQRGPVRLRRFRRHRRQVRVRLIRAGRRRSLLGDLTALQVVPPAHRVHRRRDRGTT